jgi:hypothetical protein
MKFRILEFFIGCSRKLDAISADLQHIKGAVMATATKADLDAAVAAIKTDFDAFSAAALAAIAKASTGVDVTSEVAALTDIDTSIKAGLASLAGTIPPAADTGSTGGQTPV